MRILFYIFLLLIPSSSIFADSSLLFQPSSEDSSLFMLSTILGPAVGNLVLDAGAPVQPVLAQIIEQLNLIIVTIGIGISGYVLVISIANTAQEGTVMGKKWSAVWIPMRSIAGLGMMVPSPGSGYSMIQTSVMWVVFQGIGAADSLWKIVMDGLGSGMSTQPSMSSATLPSNIDTNAQTLAQKLLNANVCMQTLQKMANLSQPDPANGPATSLYNALHGTITQPISQQAQNLLNNANKLTMYAAPGTSLQVGAQDTHGTIASVDGSGIATYTDSTGKTVAYRIPGAFNFGVSNGDSTWKNICGTIQTDTYVAAADYGLTDFKGDNSQGEQYYKNDLGKLNGTIQNLVLGLNTLMSTLANTIVSNSIVPQENVLTSSNTIDPSRYTLLKNKSQIDDSALSPNGYFKMASDSFKQTILSGGVVPGSENNQSDLLKQTIDLGNRQGWISASFFYFVMAQNSASSTNIFQSLKQDSLITANSPECTSNEGNSQVNNLTCIDNVYSNGSNSGVPYKYDGNFGTNGTQLSKAFTSSTTDYEYILGYLAMYFAQANQYSLIDATSLSGQIAGNSDPQSIAQSVLNTSGNSTGNASIITSTANMMKSYSSDPILAHAQIGYNMMVGAETGFATLTGVLTALAFAVGVGSSEVAGNAFMAGHEVWSTVIIPLTLSLVLPTLLITWTMGATLFMYVPLIPFMIFTVTALGWLIAVIEAVIAAPILSLALVTPSNDELGRLTHGLGLLANLFLKPSLMIIGFLLASKLYKSAIDLVNWGMAENYAMLNQSTMLSWMAALGMYISFVLTLANKSFSLIYVLPDKVMRWLGVSGESTDVSEELGAAKKGQEGANKAGDTAATGNAQLGGKVADKSAKNSDARRSKGK